jgi:hypothetical protein
VEGGVAIAFGVSDEVPLFYRIRSAVVSVGQLLFASDRVSWCVNGCGSESTVVCGVWSECMTVARLPPKDEYRKHDC